MKQIGLLCVLLILSMRVGAQSEAPLPIQSPAVSRTHIVFSYAGRLWMIERQGGEARRSRDRGGSAKGEGSGHGGLHLAVRQSRGTGERHRCEGVGTGGETSVGSEPTVCDRW